METKEEIISDALKHLYKIHEFPIEKKDILELLFEVLFVEAQNNLLMELKEEGLL